MNADDQNYASERGEASTVTAVQYVRIGTGEVMHSVDVSHLTSARQVERVERGMLLANRHDDVFVKTVTA